VSKTIKGGCEILDDWSASVSLAMSVDSANRKEQARTLVPQSKPIAAAPIL